jgi:hypothetical protein
MVGDIKRVSLNREVLRILIEAEMLKHPQCSGCKGWRVEATDPDETGCNWKFSAGAVGGVTGGCVERIAPYVSFLRENFSLDDRWHG